MRQRVWIAGLLAASMATAAHADDVYFHKAGAEWSQYETDTKACFLRTLNTQSDVANNAGAGAGGGLIGAIAAGIVTGIMAAMEQHKQRTENISYCMALNGWTAVDIDNLRDDDKKTVDVDLLLDERIKAWFSQPTPPVGKVTIRPEDTQRVVSIAPPITTLETALAEQAARRNRN